MTTTTPKNIKGQGLATPADLNDHELSVVVADLQNQIYALKRYSDALQAGLRADANGNLIVAKNLTVRGDHTVKGDIHAAGDLVLD